MIDSKTKEQFIMLRAQGLSFDKIAKVLKLCKATLLDLNKEFTEEIANLKNIELDSLNERYYLSRQSKIMLFGKVLENIKNELEHRNLTDIPTDKLLDMLLKYHTHLEAERIEPIFKSPQEVEQAKNERKMLDNIVMACSTTKLKTA